MQKGCKAMQMSRDLANAVKMGPRRGAKARGRCIAFLLPTDLPDVHRVTVVYPPPKLQEAVRYHDPAARIR